MGFGVILKIVKLCGILEQKEIYIIHNHKINKYWDIVKIIVFNLLAAHTLSIILNAVGSYSLNNCLDNWYTLKNIDTSHWI